MKIFFDVDTQNDFMNKDGALYVPNAELIKPNLAKIREFARKNRGIFVMGSVDVHFGTEEYKERETELQRNGGPFPDHCMCMYGTGGINKIDETVIDDSPHVGDLTFYIDNPLITKRTREEIKAEYDEMNKWNEEARIQLEIKFGIKLSKETVFTDEHVNKELKREHTGICEQSLESALEIVRNHPKNWDIMSIYFEKQSYDVFTNPNAEELLKRANVTEAVVYGVATDYCVKAAVLGMQKRGIQCYVVEDAIKGVSPDTTKSALEEMVNAGAKFVTTKEVIGE